MARILRSSPDEKNLCKEVLQVQLAMGWPGLKQEVKNICQKVGLLDVTKQYVSRKEILKYIQYYHLKLAKENMKQDNNVIIQELDGVGPVDNRPSTTSSTPLS